MERAWGLAPWTALGAHRLALGAVQWEFSRTAELGAPKAKVYDAFLEYIQQDLVRGLPEQESVVKPPVRRPNGACSAVTDC